mgnify:FL=1
MQNESFWNTKGVLLHLKTNTFEVQKDSFFLIWRVELGSSVTNYHELSMNFNHELS